MLISDFKQRPSLTLTGAHGKPFVILERAVASMRLLKWTEEEIEAFTTEAIQHDYAHLLSVVTRHCNIE